MAQAAQAAPAGETCPTPRVAAPGNPSRPPFPVNAPGGLDIPAGAGVVSEGTALGLGAPQKIQRGLRLRQLHSRWLRQGFLIFRGGEHNREVRLWCRGQWATLVTGARQTKEILDITDNPQPLPTTAVMALLPSLPPEVGRSHRTNRMDQS